MEFPLDRFSASGPDWVSLNEAERKNVETVVEILGKRFFCNIGEIIDLKKVAGLEVNSNHLLLVGKVNSSVIKFLAVEDVDIIDSNIRIYDHIKNAALPGPRMTSFDQGDILGQPFIVMNHISGRYFSGTTRDLSLVGDAICKLHKGFSNFKGLEIGELQLLQCNSKQILAEFMAAKASWDTKFGTNLAQILRQNVNLLIATEARCSSHISELSQLEKTNLHTDLHPHNIIVGNDQASIIDVDSLKSVAWPSALGFAFYKLARQVLALHGLRENHSDLKCFFEKISGNYNTSSDKIRLCFFGGLTEIFRRILIILDGNLGPRVSPWNEVLEIQIRALSEIYWIYERVLGLNMNDNQRK
ncbi:aminoglycoside phosphotransferase family protein [Planktomarina temperata]|nr:aminoglycoside phosphotransferase family protein [Planktomarina temperata]